MKSKAKLFSIAAALFIIFVGIGYYAVKSSSYMDVSQVLKLNHRAEVTVKGRLVGTQYDAHAGELYIVLEGKNGAKLVAIASAKYIEEKYGPIQYLQWDPNNVVIQGIYDPHQHVLIVTNILEGCHSNYNQPATRA